MRLFLYSFFVCLCCISLYSCGGNDEPVPPEPAEIPASLEINGFDEPTFNRIRITATLTTGTRKIVKKGFCYATAPDVDISKSVVEILSSGSAMQAYLMDLSGNTTYYVKAFAVTGKETVYSAEKSFTTPKPSTNEQLDNYVAPTYNDNYTSIADWSLRGNWNLANVHDPTVMLADDGYFYMFQTDASYGNAHAGHGHFHARRSKNLVDWEYMGATMPTTPDWVKTKLNEYRATQGLPAIDNPSYGYWAPVARNLGNGRYRMYYCIIIDNYIKTGKQNTVANFDNSWTERAFIGLAETSDPAGNVWEDKGFIVCSASDKGMNDWYRASLNDWNSAYFLYNAIDPTYTITKEGEHWLTYGSWHSGIVTLQVDPATGKPLNQSGAPWDISINSSYGKLISKRGNSRWQGSEAPEVVYNPKTDYYYLFLAYDELSVAYNTRVARSRNIDGPYIGIDGQSALTTNELLPVVTHPYKFSNSYGWVGISHCTVFEDGKGNWYYASQGRLPDGVPGINASNAVMMGHIRAISWTTDGWPLVMPERYGVVPEIPVEESELTGDWEHIDLSYSYGKQKESGTMTLSADHKITEGAWKGSSWSYDSAKGILTANGVNLYLRREVDWEASPRTHTIVYAGYTATKTYWGKKNKNK